MKKYVKKSGHTLVANKAILSFAFSIISILSSIVNAQSSISYLVVEGNLCDNLKKLSFTPDIYSPNYLLVTEELVQQCHAKSMNVILCTVNDKEKIQDLKAIGVDGIISDYPNLF